MDNIKKYEPYFSSWYVDSLIESGEYGKVYLIHRSDYGKDTDAVMKVISIPLKDRDVAVALSDGMSKEQLSKYYKNIVDSIVADCSALAEIPEAKNISCYEECTLIRHEDNIGWDIVLKAEKLTPVSHSFSNNSLTKADIIRLGIEICSALETSHAYNILHKDINPNNIYIDSSGAFKLGDFGIVSRLRKLGSQEPSVAYGFSAPEVYENDNETALSDIYSLGLVLYRLLNNNQAPFISSSVPGTEKENESISFSRRMSAEALPPLQNVSDNLSDVILKACAYKASDRYSSASEFREALEGVLFADIREKKSNLKSSALSDSLQNRPAVHVSTENNMPHIENSEPATESNTENTAYQESGVQLSPEERARYDPDYQPIQESGNKDMDEKKNNKILSVVMMVFSVLVFLGVGAYILFSLGIFETKSEPKDGTEGNFSYSIMSDKTAIVTSYTGYDNVVSVPEKLGGAVVSGIGADAFANNGFMIAVNLPSGIKTIGSGAFYNCDSLTSVSIPNGVTSLGEGAFSGCDNLMSVSLPSTLSETGKWAFAYCDSLQNVEMPVDNSVGITTISYAAFYDCDKLTNIVMPDTVATISEGAFSSCDALTNVSLSRNTITIGDYAFSDCPSLKNISIPYTVNSIGMNSFKGSENVTIYTPQNSYAAQYALTYGCDYVMQ